MSFISEAFLSNGVAPSYDEIAIGLGVDVVRLADIIGDLGTQRLIRIEDRNGSFPRVHILRPTPAHEEEKPSIQLSPEQQAQATLNSWHAKGLISNPHNQNLLNELLTAAQTIEAARRNTRTESL